jgi:hypothetical protein
MMKLHVPDKGEQMAAVTAEAKHEYSPSFHWKRVKKKVKIISQQSWNDLS